MAAAEGGAAAPPVDASTMFRADEFLAQFPGGFLNAHTAMDYLKLSPFYEANEKGELPQGVEYVVVQAQEPHLFVIRKQLRHGSSVKHQTHFYLLDGSIYQAPTMHGVISARLNRCLHNIRGAFELLEEELNVPSTDEGEYALAMASDKKLDTMPNVSEEERAHMHRESQILKSMFIV